MAMSPWASPATATGPAREDIHAYRDAQQCWCSTSRGSDVSTLPPKTAMFLQPRAHQKTKKMETGMIMVTLGGVMEAGGAMETEVVAVEITNSQEIEIGAIMEEKVGNCHSSYPKVHLSLEGLEETKFVS